MYCKWKSRSTTKQDRQQEKEESRHEIEGIRETSKREGKRKYGQINTIAETNDELAKARWSRARGRAVPEFLGFSLVLWNAKTVLSVLYECSVDLIPRIIATGEGRKNVSLLSLCMPPDTACLPHILYSLLAMFLILVICLLW
jgi:hypothetical protein